MAPLCHQKCGKTGGPLFSTRTAQRKNVVYPSLYIIVQLQQLSMENNTYCKYKILLLLLFIYLFLLLVMCGC